MADKKHLEWIGFRGSRWAWAATLSAIAFWASVAHGPERRPEPPVPNPASPQVPLQEYTTDATLPLKVGVSFVAKLPAPDPRQRKPPCVTRVGEEAIGGYCWLKLSIRPPCPVEEHAHEHKGNCYMAVLRAASQPTSGEGQLPVGVSSPP